MSEHCALSHDDFGVSVANCTVRVVLMPAARQILGFSSLSDGCLTSPVVACLVTPTWCGEKGSPPPSPAASSTTAAGTSEEEGLHTCPLPHILGMAFYLVSGDFGGGRIGTSPFLLTMPVSTSEEEGQALLLTMSASTSEEEGQAFLLAPSVCTSCTWSGITMS